MNPLLEDKQVWFTSKFMSVFFSRGYDFSFHFLKFVFERILNENSFFFANKFLSKDTIFQSQYLAQFTYTLLIQITNC